MGQGDGLSRRAVLGAMGGAVAGGLVSAGVANVAGAAPVRLSGDQPSDTVQPAAMPLLKAGLSYYHYGPMSFRSGDPAVPGVLGPGYVSAPTRYIQCDLQLPVGAVIDDVVVWVANDTGSTLTVDLVKSPIDVSAFPSSVLAISVPDNTVVSEAIVYSGPAVQLEAGSFYALSMSTPTSFAGFRCARIGVRNTAAFVPVTPYRCYDSRVMGTTLPLAPNSSRTIDVTKKIDASTGAVIGSGMIPSTARAVTFNMVAAGATGGNYFAAVAGNVVSSSTAHINFNTQTPTVANAGTVDLFAGTLKAICGGGSGSAHCIVDITGYYF